MRLVEVIPHPIFKISVYSHDLHYYIEIEGGPMKQCFKFSKELVSAEKGGITALLDEAFLGQVKTVFDTMHQNFSDAIRRYKSH
ncbi:MAG: hypothetical protein ACK4EX_04050 [Thermaurantimonas sp.]|uniref:hypothetical protein n=1 Tax=Thermaurantimonas sp. TaxID=2681568 RepID=UPI00391995D0